MVKITTQIGDLHLIVFTVWMVDTTTKTTFLEMAVKEKENNERRMLNLTYDDPVPT